MKEDAAPGTGGAGTGGAGTGGAGTGSGAGSSVLVVDDSPGTLGMMSAALESAGYKVLLAQSGAAALALTERVTPDIVLMDAVMPGMDGFETCKLFKRSRMNASVPVVFMTGLTETEHVVRALDAGGVDYLTKPVALAELIARVGVHLANARLTQSAQAALDSTGRYLLAMNRAGDLVWTTPRAGAWLAAGEGGEPDSALVSAPGTEGSEPGGSEPGGSEPGARALPESVVAWGLGCAADPERRKPLTFAAPRTGRHLEITYVGRISADEILFRLVAVDQGADERNLRERLKVTAREAEVLLWISRGKTNRDIAEILGLSPRTVNKHLEQIFGKIGVENRAAAAIQVVNILRGG